MVEGSFLGVCFRFFLLPKGPSMSGLAAVGVHVGSVPAFPSDSVGLLGVGLSVGSEGQGLPLWGSKGPV